VSIAVGVFRKEAAPSLGRHNLRVNGFVVPKVAFGQVVDTDQLLTPASKQHWKTTTFR